MRTSQERLSTVFASQDARLAQHRPDHEVEYLKANDKIRKERKRKERQEGKEAAQERGPQLREVYTLSCTIVKFANYL